MAEVKKKRNDLTLKEKQEILERYDKLPRMSQRNAAVHLNISQPVLCKILKNRSDIESAVKQNQNLHSKRNRSGKDVQVESALKLWFSNVREQDARVDGPLMRQKAEELAKKMEKEDFTATEGWFHRWKKRESIVYKRTYGEQKDADFLAAEHWIQHEWGKIVSEFSPTNVYNADETGLYYRALPEHTYLFKSETAKGCKASKERITILCCVSMSGMKERLLVIGKSRNPRCFRGVNKLPVDYYSNTNAWMTATIFNEWLVKWDNRLDHKIALLVDNCTAHLVNCSLRYINVIFLPANTTPLIQPCDQGIIRTLKAYYHREMRARILETMEDMQQSSANDLAKKTSLLDAIHLIASSWDRVSDNTIQNCFKHGGFSTKVREGEELALVELKPPDIPVSEFKDWMAIDQDICVTSRVTEDDVCEAVSSKDVEQIEDFEDDVTQEYVKPPTNAEVRSALEILRRAVQHRSTNFGTHYQYECFINDLLRKNYKQTSLKDFYKA